MKPVDLDELFRRFAKNYISENSAEIAGKDDDEILSFMYREFETTGFPDLGGKTPLTFYGGDLDYAQALAEHAANGVAIDDYLVDAAVRFADEQNLLSLLTPEADENVVITAIDVLEKKESKIAFNRYIDLLFDEKTDECVIEKLVEVLADHADDVCDGILSRVSADCAREDDAAYILSHSREKKDGIAKLILRGLNMGDKIAEYCANAITYGDESILPDLEEMIDGVDDYVSFKELNLAIEALGGKMRAERNFENDKDYIKIKETAKRAAKGEDGDKDQDG